MSCAVLLLRSVSAAAQDLADTSSEVPCAACTVVSLTPSQAAMAPANLAGSRVVLRIPAGERASVWTAALADLRGRAGRVGFHIVGVPEANDSALDQAGAVLLIELRGTQSENLAYQLKAAFTRARAANDKTTLVLAASDSTLQSLRDDLAAYVDAFLTLGQSDARDLDDNSRRWIAGQEEGAIDTLQTAADLARPVSGGNTTRLWMLPADGEQARRLLENLAALQAWLPSGLVGVTDRRLSCGSIRLRTYLDPQTLDVVGTARGCPVDGRIDTDTQQASIDRLDVPGMTLVRVRNPQGDRFAAGVDVTGARELSVEEIVARHQAAAARQSATIRTQISTGTLTLTFEAPGFIAPVSVTSETVVYQSEDRIDLQQRDIRVNGVLFKGTGGVPRLPIIEPERVASLPLAIALTRSYRYTLKGRETIAGRPCYVVAFEPREPNASLYEGRAWIAVDGFGLARVSAVQTGLRGPITASEQTDDFRTTPDGYWILARSDVRQTYEGAAVRTPIHRRLVVDRHEINPADFDKRRAGAYASTDVMLRDTPQGFRYLKRPRSDRGPEAPAAVAATEPVLAGRADRLRTLAFGVLVDPNISRPLPFVGLSYVDLNLFNRGVQLNAFFGGTFGQLALSAPSLGGTRWQLGARAFGIASSYNDRAFEQGRELYEQDIEQRPAQATAWLLHPLTPRASVRFGYEWNYTHYDAGDQTTRGFVVPANQVVHSVTLGVDLQREGWQASLWWSPAWRTGWRPWGEPGTEDFRSPKCDFQRYGISVSRSGILRPGLTTRVEAAVMGGGNLDRFSRYAFGTFDNRLHGYPSALIRYDRGGVLRTAVAWAAAKAVRIDAFADTAAVHDPGFSQGLRNYTGFGTALEAPAPFRTLLALEWGYGLRGVNNDGSQGTHVVRLTGYKVF